MLKIITRYLLSSVYVWITHLTIIPELFHTRLCRHSIYISNFSRYIQCINYFAHSSADRFFNNLCIIISMRALEISIELDNSRGAKRRDFTGVTRDKKKSVGIHARFAQCFQSVDCFHFALSLSLSLGRRDGGRQAPRYARVINWRTTAGGDWRGRIVSHFLPIVLVLSCTPIVSLRIEPVSYAHITRRSACVSVVFVVCQDSLRLLRQLITSRREKVCLKFLLNCTLKGERICPYKASLGIDWAHFSDIPKTVLSNNQQINTNEKLHPWNLIALILRLFIDW